MSNLNLHLDKKAEQSIEDLKQHYGAGSKAEVIRKALALLQVAARIEKGHGTLYAKGKDESGTEKTIEIIVS